MVLYIIVVTIITSDWELYFSNSENTFIHIYSYNISNMYDLNNWAKIHLIKHNTKKEEYL